MTATKKETTAMIDLIFYHGTEVIFIRVTEGSIKFTTSSQKNIWSSIEGLKLSKEGVIKEFPELKDNPEWKAEAIKRFKEHIMSMKTEDERVEYIIKDLKSHGYIPKFKQRHGFRRVTL